MAASPHSWDFLLPPLMELALPLLREARRLEHRGGQLNQSHRNILAQRLVRSKSDADILAATGLKFLATQPAPICEIGSSMTPTVHHNEHVR